ncbi:hypothetical protein [Aquicella lusitana]|uniref:Cell division protein ZapB n=1 Tax=Aquicella lusitana TaxID=254246 RepID=A0A370GQP6_9COXI|nr:hypothetical protein [Aquicella lusitana]RDI44814.1 hypothetical protein C8D86_10868 [Aquicella lusitana]VVC73011.1 hypothetical protein AQULUS_07390 [Aquicella lusitana]
MTENLLQKLEEKMMTLLSEVEDLRNEVQRLNQENSSLKMEKENHTKKVQDLISLLDAINVVENTASHLNHNMTTVKPVLLQDIQERAF